MKKFLSCLLSALLALTVLPLAAGCGEKKAEAALAYNDGINEDGSYDTDLYYRNDLLLNHAADPDVLWVPEERDETWGGYYYLYTTNVYYNIIVMRSKDLSNWEKVGMALDFDGSQWCTHNICGARSLTTKLRRNIICMLRASARRTWIKTRITKCSWLYPTIPPTGSGCIPIRTHTATVTVRPSLTSVSTSTIRAESSATDATG